MASGRVGGTKSKISGQIGSEIYSLRRNPDGTYSQVVSAKPEQVQYSNTEKQAAYRMAAAVVESAMRDLAPIARFSIQTAANASLSLNEFSSLNLKRVQEDMKAHWYSGEKFLYNKKGESLPLGGNFLISSGTLGWNFWDGPYFGLGYPVWMRYPDTPYPLGWKEWGGMTFYAPQGYGSIQRFFKFHGWGWNDVNVYVAYFKNEHWQEPYDPDDPQIVEDYKFCYAICSYNQDIDPELPCTEENIRKLIRIDSNVDFEFMHNPVTDRYGVIFKVPESELEISLITHAKFTITDVYGYKQVYTSEMLPVMPSLGYDWETGHTPSEVFYSWLNETRPTIKPSPFEE